jgi:hypothetical protein
LGIDFLHRLRGALVDMGLGAPLVFLWSLSYFGGHYTGLHASFKKEEAMIIVPIVLMDIMTCFFAFKEAWGYSRTGTDGIKLFLGHKIEDHAVWKVERFIFMCVAISFAIVAWQTLVTWLDLGLFVFTVSASWGGKFLLAHQYTYNFTMVKLKVEGYSIGIKESERTTSTKSSDAVKITLATIGILIIPIYYLFK